MIEVGEYVRVDGKIGKVLGFCECDECQRRGYLEPIIDNINIYITKYDKENGFEDIKHSPNIIDLLKKGDYVNGCEVDEVCEAPNEEIGRVIETYTAVGYEDTLTIYKEHIKTILTKEQYEANCYKLEEEK